MDGDDLRRSRPTLHRAYDETTAVLAGDALLTFAFEIADPAAHADPQMRCKLITARQSLGRAGMVAGQAADMAGGDIGSIHRRHAHEPAQNNALINFAVEAGALIGYAGDAERTALSRYAHDVDLAFQMVDDLLDAEGAARDTGKPSARTRARQRISSPCSAARHERARRIAVKPKTPRPLRPPRENPD